MYKFLNFDTAETAARIEFAAKRQIQRGAAGAAASAESKFQILYEYRIGVPLTPNVLMSAKNSKFVVGARTDRKAHYGKRSKNSIDGALYPQ